MVVFDYQVDFTEIDKNFEQNFTLKPETHNFYISYIIFHITVKFNLVSSFDCDYKSPSI